MSRRPTTARPSSSISRAGRASLVVLVLAAAWLVAILAWRGRWPAMMAISIAVAWPIAVLAWRPLWPSGWRATLALAGVLLAIDVLLDTWLDAGPTRRLLAPVPETAHLAGLVVASAASLRLPPRAWLRRSLAVTRVLAASPLVLLVVFIVVVGWRGTRDDTGEADAILVLGYALSDSGQAQPSLVARIDHAAHLYRLGLAPRVVVSGGAERAGVREAEVMRDLLVARGVPRGAVVLEDRANSTVQNFACAAPILQRLDAQRVLVVTEPWHMARALLQAEPYRDGIELAPSPASSPDWRSWRRKSAHLTNEAINYMFAAIRRHTEPRQRCPEPAT